ncbi:nuclease [Ancylobacter sp. A5.8]|uniref:thermonuclease family protein n=1 Tax=Ancylobacter gelatini TaxID=2919920 RepID=UPI001F4EC0EC|nr:nuclease [Ancylobacter gelatini]MCJ8145130.1 nuclease [Ancylobacter gelatini]
MGLPSSTVAASRLTGCPLFPGAPHRAAASLRACTATITGLVALLMTALPALAATPCPDDYRPLGRVTGVTDAGELVLEDSRLVRLAAIDAAGGEAAMAAFLGRTTPGRMASLAQAGAGTDRHGRHAGLVRLDAENGQASIALQAALLADGLAVARPEPGFLGCMDSFAEAERPARQGRQGLWAHLPLAAGNIAALNERRGRFTILAGRVLTVGTGRVVDYLNFGVVWRKDATVRLEKDVSRALTQRGIALADVAGRRVAVRGPVVEDGGPAIDIRWIEQIAAVDDVWEGQKAGDR